jgi:hypothetical protein
VEVAKMTRPLYPFSEWDFRTISNDIQLIPNISNNNANIALIRGYNPNIDNTDPVSSPLGFIFDNVNDILGLQLANHNYGWYNNGASGFSFTILIKPTNLTIGSGRNLLFDFSINGNTLSAASAWFTDTGALKFGGRSSLTDSFYSKTTGTTTKLAFNDVWVACGGVMNYTNKSITVYKNGKQFENSVSAAFNSNYYVHGATSYTLFDKIGMSLDMYLGYPLSGTVMYIIFYPRALTATEMHNLYLYIQKTALVSGVII